MEPIIAKADAFMANIDDAINSICIRSLLSGAGPSTSEFKITTMTVLVASSEPISLEALKQTGGKGFPGSLTMSTSADVFFNCVMCTLTGADEKRKGIKIFSNGQLHITGAKSVHDAIQCSREVYAAIGAALGRSSAAMAPTDFTVQMINGHFKFNIRGVLKLDAMHSICLKDTPHVSRYNPENHAGLLVRIATGGITVVFFESGSVLINAFSCGEELLKAHDFALDFVTEHFDTIVSAGTGAVAGANKRRRTKLDTGGFDYGKYLVLK
jgi:TATA-box binding protein (TBP) (component of TFIID and TFIIIB)